jgi:hypothetical protein
VRSKAIIWPPDRFNMGGRQSFIFIKEIKTCKLL